MRRVADACNPANLPGWQYQGSYVDGLCAANANTVFRISSLGTNAGNTLDVEPGNPVTALGAPSWAHERRAAGEPWVWVYCFMAGTNGVQDGSGFTYNDLVTAFEKAGEPDPLWWVAIPASERQGLMTPMPVGQPGHPIYMVQVLYDQGVGYDIDLLEDYVPGFDPPPDPPKPAEEIMFRFTYGNPPAQFVSNGLQYIWIPNQQGITNYDTIFAATGQGVSINGLVGMGVPADPTTAKMSGQPWPVKGPAEP